MTGPRPSGLLRGAAVAVALGAAGFSSLATADQCALVERPVATTAALVIGGSHGRLLEHCAPCGDPPPSLAAAFVPARVESAGGSVTIDGVARDLAYLYLEVAPGVFENVGLRSGCAASGVPEVWDFTSGTPTRRAFGAPPVSLRALGWGGPPAAFGRGVRPPPPG